MKGVSIIIPCLNEAETIGRCIEKAQQSLRKIDLPGEVIVADNGSTDDSREIAQREGATVIRVQQKGYGCALQGGIEAARYDWIIMGDADDSYDFSEIDCFLKELAAGKDLVQGCRLPSGGGVIAKGAMPWLHRWLGNPFFSFLVRQWFKAPIHDVYCGMRAFTKALYTTLDLRCTGMEFATEMIIKASLIKAKIGEVPIILHKDGRKNSSSHLRTWRDGWRTLRFFCMYCPRWLFFYPGVVLILLGLLEFFLGLFYRHAAASDFQSLLIASLCVICGYEAILLGVFTKIFSVRSGFLPPDPRFDDIFRYLTLERGLLGGMLLFVLGFGFVISIQFPSGYAPFDHLNHSTLFRTTTLGVTTSAIGLQTILASFMVSILGLHRR